MQHDALPCSHSSLTVLYFRIFEYMLSQSRHRKQITTSIMSYHVIYHPRAPSKMHHAVWLHKINCDHLKHSLALSTPHTSQLFAVFLVWDSKTKEAKLHKGGGGNGLDPTVWGVGERTRIYFIHKTKHQRYSRILLPTLNQDFWTLTVTERPHFSILHVLLCKVENWQIRGTCHTFQLQMFA